MHHKLLFPTNKMASPIFVHPHVIRPNRTPTPAQMTSPHGHHSNSHNGHHLYTSSGVAGNRDDYVYFIDNFVCEGHAVGTVYLIHSSVCSQ
jgi:hypothetical protein